MIIEGIILGIIVGLIRRGKISRIEHVKINLSPLIFLSLLAHLAIVVLNLGLLSVDSIIYSILLIAANAFVFILLAFNLDKRFMFMPLVGLMMNFICMAVNNFKIPIRSDLVSAHYGDELSTLLIDGSVKFFIPSQDAILGFLGKIYNTGQYYFYDIIFSLGDVVVFIGLVLIIQDLMTDKFIKTRDSLTISKNLYKPKKRK